MKHLILCLILIYSNLALSGQSCVQRIVTELKNGKLIAPDDISQKDLLESGLSKSHLATSKVKPLAAKEALPLERRLREENLKVVKKLNDNNKNEVFLVELPDGTQAVFKPHSFLRDSNYRTEVLAYEFDKALGLELVPVTVVREFDGKIGSLQLFVKAPNVGEAKPLEMAKQTLLDILMKSSDRHRGNYLIAQDGSVVSIDNGYSFHSIISNKVDGFHEVIEELKLVLSSSEGIKIISNIKKLVNDSMFSKGVASYIGNEDTLTLIERMQFIVDYKNFLDRKVTGNNNLASYLLSSKRITNFSVQSVLPIIHNGALTDVEVELILEKAISFKEMNNDSFKKLFSLFKSAPQYLSNKLSLQLVNHPRMNDYTLSLMLEALAFKEKVKSSLLQKIMRLRHFQTYSIAKFTLSIHTYGIPLKTQKILLAKLLESPFLASASIKGMINFLSKQGVDAKYTNSLVKGLVEHRGFNLDCTKLLLQKIATNSLEIEDVPHILDKFKNSSDGEVQALRSMILGRI